MQKLAETLKPFMNYVSGEDNEVDSRQAISSSSSGRLYILQSACPYSNIRHQIVATYFEDNKRQKLLFGITLIESHTLWSINYHHALLETILHQYNIMDTSVGRCEDTGCIPYEMSATDT